jgi:hypothetical protein
VETHTNIYVLKIIFFISQCSKQNIPRQIGHCTSFRMSANCTKTNLQEKQKGHLNKIHTGLIINKPFWSKSICKSLSCIYKLQKQKPFKENSVFVIWQDFQKIDGSLMMECQMLPLLPASRSILHHPNILNCSSERIFIFSPSLSLKALGFWKRHPLSRSWLESSFMSTFYGAYLAKFLKLWS